MRKPGIFKVLFAALVLVIGLSICGVLGFIVLVAGGTFSSQAVREEFTDLPQAQASILADYYIARGDSWDGVETRLNSMPFTGAFYSYTLTDSAGRVIASNDRRPPLRTRARNVRRAPILVDGREVGVLVLEPGFGPPGPPMAPDAPTPPGATSGSSVWHIWRGFLLGVGGLSLMLVAVAFGLARWLSRPLRTLTFAAEQVAAGQLDVTVPGADVREVDDLAVAFNRMSSALVEADKQRRQMTADTAHELRTPLSIIKGRLEGLQDGVYTASPEQIGQLLRETELLERLVEDLRILALADSGRLPLFLEPTDPAELLGHTAAIFSAQAEAQGVRICVDAPDDVPLISIDPQRMAQVLANLVSNALRYTPAGGSITLKAAPLDATSAPYRASAAPDTPAVMLSVCDTGQGIGPDELPYIFDRFWRADRSRTRGSGGAGLGLAIVRRIVEAHGGTIEAQSEPECGTRFTILLPAGAVHDVL